MDFTYNEKTVMSSGGFIPSTNDTPLDVRGRVNLYSEIKDIPNPYVGMEIRVLQDETNEGKMTKYKVTKLLPNEFGVPNSYIDTDTLEKISESLSDEDLVFDGICEDELGVITPQLKTDYNLTTTDKTIVGAINEIKTGIDNIEVGGSSGVFETDQLTINTVGGVTTNTDLNGKTWQEIIDAIFYPYTKPVINVTGTPNGGIYEKGNTQTITNVKVVVTKKSKKIVSVEVFNGATSLGSKTGTEVENGGTFNFAVSVPVDSVNVQLTVKATDETGDSGVSSATTGAFTFVYPYYVGVCNDGVTIDEALVKGLTKKIETKANKSITYTTNNQRMVFAYPKSYSVIKSIIDPNNFDVTATFTSTTVSITGLDGTAQDYYVYVNGASTQNNFTMKFNY